MQNLYNIFIFHFLFFNLLFANPFFAQEAITIPNENFYENPDLIPIKIKNENYEEAKLFLEEKFGGHVIFTYKANAYKTIVLSREKVSALEKTKIEFTKPENPPFRFYDTTYSARLKKGFVGLEDLKTGYKDYKLNEIYMKGVAREFPELVRYFNLGKTRLGKNIPALRITANNMRDNKVSILFNCGHHSSELVGIEHCYDILYHIVGDDQSYQEILENTIIWIVPIVNPDGSFLFWYKSNLMGRKNGYLPQGASEDDPRRGVDLNRNYPFKWNSGDSRASSDDVNHPFYRGISSASEPETKAMMALAESEHFLFSISFHSYATRLLYPYTVENTKNPEPDYPKEFAQKLINYAISYHPNKKFEAVKNIYPVDGTDQDYYYFKYGAIALLAETSHKNIDFPQVETILVGFREVWRNFLKEALIGNKIILRVTDSEDVPLTAKVSILELTHHEGEEFTTNPWNGYFHKMVSEGKEYTVKIQSAGYQDEYIKVPASKDFSSTPIILKRLVH